MRRGSRPGMAGEQYFLREIEADDTVGAIKKPESSARSISGFLALAAPDNPVLAGEILFA